MTRSLSFLHQWSIKNGEEIWAETLLTDVFVVRTCNVHLLQVGDEFNPDQENVLSDDDAIISDEEVEGKVWGAHGKRGFTQAKKDRIKGKKKTEKVWASWKKRYPPRRRKMYLQTT